jgi:hypothetical protein
MRPPPAAGCWGGTYTRLNGERADLARYRGKVVARFGSGTQPDGPELEERLDAVL